MKNIFISISLSLFFLSAIDAQEKFDSFNIKTINGKTLQVISQKNGFKIPQHKGKILFLEFWGTYCPPCLISIPHYIKLQKKYKKNLAIVAIEVQDTPQKKLEKFVKSKKINYDVISYKDGYTLVNYIGRMVGWKGSIPLLIIADQQGQIKVIQPGLIAQESLEQAIEDMISKHNKASTGKTERNITK